MLLRSLIKLLLRQVVQGVVIILRVDLGESLLNIVRGNVTRPELSLDAFSSPFLDPEFPAGKAPGKPFFIEESLFKQMEQQHLPRLRDQIVYS